MKLSLLWDLQQRPVQEDDVHDQHPTELRGRSSYDHHDSLKSSEGSLQRVPSSSSRSQSSEPSEHDNLSKELVTVFFLDGFSGVQELSKDQNA